MRKATLEALSCGLRGALLFAVSACLATACASNGSSSLDGTAGTLGQGVGEASGIAFTEITATALAVQPCGPGSSLGSLGCYTNYVVVTDLDGDGNLDVVFTNGGSHFVAGQASPQSVVFGDGRGSFTEVSGTAFGGAIRHSHVRQAAVADVDGDGRLDLYLPGGYGLDIDQLFVQHENRSFVDEASTRLPNGLKSRAGGTHFGDVDDDGDIDLVVADWGANPNPDDSHQPASPVTVRIYANDGSGHFNEVATLPAPQGSTATDVDLQDVDGDFALDIVLTQRNGQSRLYLNDGSGRFSDATLAKRFPPKRGPYSFNVEACDIDGDGDLDLLFDGASAFVARHDTQVLVNDGTGAFADETSARIAAEERTDDNQVKCADVDNDGDFDLMVASLSNTSEKLLVNTDGAGHFERATTAVPARRDPTLGIDFGDFDGDGAVDFVTGQGEVPNLPWLNRVYKNTTGKPDQRGPVFRKVRRSDRGETSVIRLAVSDSHTSETGQHVRRVSVAWSDGKQGKAEARFVGGDLFRAEVPRGARITATAMDRQGNESRITVD